MKLSLIVASILVCCSCATGVSDPIEEPVEVYVAPPKIPTPKAPEPTPEPTGEPECVINAYWVNDCYVVKIYCKNKPTRVEVSCGPGRPLWPWEIIPDPPYDNRK